MSIPAQTVARPAVDTLWYTRCPVPTASGIAIQKGWLEAEFAQDGIAYRSLASSNNPAVRGSHFDHSQENSFRQGGNAPPIWARSVGRDTVVLGLTWLPQYQRLLTLPGSGIQQAQDLKGKRLALPMRVRDRIDFWRASALQGYLQVLASAGSLFDVHRQARSATAEAFALIRGEVDVIYQYGAGGPFLEAFLGAEVVVDIQAAPDWRLAINNGTPNVLTCSGALARQRPDLVVRHLVQVLRAAAWAEQHQTEALALIANDVSVVPDWVTQAFDPEQLFSCLWPSFSESLVEALELRSHFLYEHGFIPSNVDLKAWLRPDLLEAAYAEVDANKNV